MVRGVYERAHDVLLRDELRVVRVIARGGGRARELRDVRAASAALEEAFRVQALAERQEVYRVALLHELAHAVEDVAVLLRIEGVRLYGVRDVMDSIRLQEQGTEERALGVEALGRDAKRGVLGGGHCPYSSNRARE